MTTISRPNRLASGAPWLGAVLLFLVVGVAEAQPDTGLSGTPGRWLRPDGQPLPFTTHSEVLAVLSDGEVVAVEEIPTGTSNPRKLTLRKDDIRLNAIFRTVDAKALSANQERTHEAMLRDSFAYEVAAYRLSLMLGLDSVPPVVLRTIDGQEGSLQLWVEQANSLADMEASGQGVDPPLQRFVDVQRISVAVFDNLVYNFDRNTGNLLIDAHGKVWFVDHTRTFTRRSQLPHPEVLLVCERQLWQRLRDLDPRRLEQELGPFLEGSQLAALKKRQRTLVRHFERLIEKNGEDQVLFDLDLFRPRE